MEAQIIELSAYRSRHPRPAVRMRIVYDPLWMWRVWLSCWGIK
jgi:hypothetical protein